jgi:hypothetical protein
VHYFKGMGDPLILYTINQQTYFLGCICRIELIPVLAPPLSGSSRVEGSSWMSGIASKLPLLLSIRYKALPNFLRRCPGDEQLRMNDYGHCFAGGVF